MKFFERVKYAALSHLAPNNNEAPTGRAQESERRTKRPLPSCNLSEKVASVFSVEDVERSAKVRKQSSALCSTSAAPARLDLRAPYLQEKLSVCRPPTGKGLVRTSVPARRRSFFTSPTHKGLLASMGDLGSTALSEHDNSPAMEEMSGKAHQARRSVLTSSIEGGEEAKPAKALFSLGWRPRAILDGVRLRINQAGRRQNRTAADQGGTVADNLVLQPLSLFLSSPPCESVLKTTATHEESFQQHCEVSTSSPSQKDQDVWQEIDALEKELLKLKVERVEEAWKKASAPTTRAKLPERLYEQYNELTKGGNPSKQLVAHERSNIVITRKDMATLSPQTWLNDEVVNVYMALLQERDTERRKKNGSLKCHFFSTFFCNKLYKDGGYEYGQVRRWTTPQRLKMAGQASTSVLDCDLLLVPVHQGMHWVCAAIDLQQKKFIYCDSLKHEDKACLQNLSRWLCDEYENKRKEKKEDVMSWPRVFPKDVPQQRNGSDCGMFMLLFADYLSRGESMDFAQDDIDDFRVKMVDDIINLKVS